MDKNVEQLCTMLKEECEGIQATADIDEIDARVFNVLDLVLLLLKSTCIDPYENHSDGGPGSGNHGHEGRPGEVGGSLPDSNSMNERIRNAYKSGDYTSVGSEIRSVLKECPVGTKFTHNGLEYTKTGDNEYTAFNPRFNRNVKDNANSIANSTDAFNPEAAPVFHEIKSKDVAAAKISNGELMPEETSVKTAEYNGSTNGYVDKETYSDRKAQFQKNAGREFSDEEVAEMVDAVTEYTGTDYMNILAAQMDFGGRFGDYSRVLSDSEKEKALRDSEAVERAIKYSDKYTGTVKRALGFDLDGEYDTSDEFNKFMSTIKEGNTIEMDTMTSWTTSDSIVQQILGARAGLGDECESYAEVVLTCKSKTGVDIANLSTMHQSEVLFGKSAKFKVKSVKENHRNKAGYDVTRVDIEMEEVV